eukprot:CAMPEP_0114619982 /NCGR_PEP_ID=MMETSP0168-20121206/8486_1 /TAXON_ID=95228 ORGANISM="Vannella sp., Strain DIVA3 517/6/12" /NCGR_SAMPLE_ID=MMETSP0168 /ASSEMBLY_ACC=CAM_ASM_000044 /LENGTH=656 /DNA_ID=CAMNT_0001831151 /DNA_START=35 /DNA_END=2005 /DNA_ORIENTATION=-
MVQSANSGHPGAPMGMAPMAHVLWSKIMNYAPSKPNWYNRDRFVLSNGHGCALLYTLLHLAGYEQFDREQVTHFRQLGYRTAGHPESHYEGIEVTTGPLGQGFSNAVGLAMATEHLAATYHKDGFEGLFDNFTYVFCGDGCLMEGVTAEAASLAGHLALGRLIVLYDDNKISIDGSTDLSFTEDVTKRFESYGWEVLEVKDGDNDLAGIENAVNAAKKSLDRPTLIRVKTTIGLGSVKEGTSKVHGSPLGDEDLANVKKKYGFNPEEKFVIPEEVKATYEAAAKAGNEKAAQWQAAFEEYAKKHPELAAEITKRFESLPTREELLEQLPKFSPSDANLASRASSQKCLAVLNKTCPQLFGGSADLAPSNLTIVNDMTDFQKGNYAGKNIRFGVREHGMAAIVNGLSAYGGFVPYGATFLNFLGYCQGAVTLSALSGHHVFFIMTHDSIGLGEDGPTHQPVDKLLAARATPNLLLIRPGDGNEVAGTYAVVLSDPRPSVLALSRQGLPNLAESSAAKVANGAYVLIDVDGTPDAIIVATGSELHIAVKASKDEALKGRKVRVVSMPCWELFDEQSADYKLSVFPDGVPVVSVEAGCTTGWDKYAHASIGVETFGASGPAGQIYKKFGITGPAIAAKVEAAIKFYAGKTVASRVNRPF